MSRRHGAHNLMHRAQRADYTSSRQLPAIYTPYAYQIQITTRARKPRMSTAITSHLLFGHAQPSQPGHYPPAAYRIRAR